MNFTAQAARASLTGDKIQTDLTGLLARTTLRKDLLAPLLIHAETGLSKINMKGSARDLFTEPGFDVTVDATVSLPELKDALRLSEELTGEMTIRFDLEGTLDNPEFKMYIGYDGGIIAGVQVDSANLDAGFIDRILEVNDAHIVSDYGTVTATGHVDLQKVFPEGIFAGNRQFDALSYSFSINGEGIELERLPVNDTALEGKVNTNIDFSGTGISFESISSRISAGISCERLVFNQNGPVVDVSIKALGRIEGYIARVDVLEVSSAQASLEARGSLDLSSKEVMARIELDVPDLEGILKPFDVHGDGRLSIAAEVSETISLPMIEFFVNGKQLRFEGITVGNITCTGGLDRQGIVRISSLVLKNKGSRIQGSGSARLFERFPDIRTDQPLNVAAEIHSVNVQDFIDVPGFKGVFDGEVMVDGSVDTPDALINLTATGINIKDYRIGNVRSSMGFSEGMFLLDNVLVENNRSRLHISGEVKVFDPETKHFFQDPQIRINLDGATVFLQDIAQGLTGRVNAAVSLEGSMKHPQGSVSLSGNNIDLGFQKIDEILVLSTLKDQRIMLETLKLVPGIGDEPITGTGWFSLQKEYAFQLSGSGISLENIDVLAANHVSSGWAGFSITGNGTYAEPCLEGEFFFGDVFVNQERLGDVRIVLDLHDNIVRLKGKQGLDFHATYLIAQGDLSGSVVFDSLDLSPYFQIARYPDLSGTVTGKIEGSGNIHSIKDVKASMDLNHLRVNFMNRQIISGESLRASLEGKEFSVPGIHLVLGEKGWINIEGGGELHGNQSIRAQGDIPLQVLDPFIEDLSDTSGSLLLSGHMELVDGECGFMGELELREISFRVPYTDQLIHGTSGRIVMTPKALELKNIAGASETGSFDLSGTVALKAMRPEEIDMRLQAWSLPVNVPDTLDLLVDMDVVVRGNRDDTRMQGSVVLLEGLYYKDVEVDFVKRVVGESPETRAPRGSIGLAFLRNMKLDISISRRNPLFIDNNIAQLDINPDLRLSGTLNDPVIYGRSTIESGTVVFRNRIFTVTKGVIDFLDPYATRATIDVHSKVRVRDWKIYLDVFGTPDALSISLRSDPPAEDNDILSLIVLGRTSQEIITGKGGRTPSASTMVATLIASRYGEDIREFTGLDLLELESGVDDDFADTVRLTIGKELSRRIMLKYAMELKDSEISQRAVAEYRLFENIVLNGFQDTRGIFGADMLYRLEFR